MALKRSGVRSPFGPLFVGFLQECRLGDTVTGSLKRRADGFGVVDVTGFVGLGEVSK